MGASQVAVVLKGYPRLSETFVAQELHGLEQAGLALQIYSLRHPTDDARHPVHDSIRAPVAYLPEYLRLETGRVRQAFLTVRRLPGYPGARRAFLRDLRRDKTRNRIRRFGQAMVLAAEMPPEIKHVYAHFLHTPASVARYAALMRGLPWSGSAHAKDIWTTPAWEKSEKLDSASWTVTCTRSGHAHLDGLSGKEGRVHLVYHGLDITALPPAPKRTPSDIGQDRPLEIVSVGRLVAKKGYDILLDALARLPAALPWRLIHIGRWDLKDQLVAQADRLDLSDRIVWRGPEARDAVFNAYAAADLFVLASRVADDGDRDGLPNVLMEAMSQSLPCIATNISGIPELIEDGRTGLLCPPEDPGALSGLIAKAATDPGLRQQLGVAASEHVRANFDFQAGLEQLLTLFDQLPVR